MSQQKKLLLLVLLGVLAWWLWKDHTQPGQPADPAPANPAPAPKPQPHPDPDDGKRPPRVPHPRPPKPWGPPRVPHPPPLKPWGPHQNGRSAVESAPGKPVEGGRTSPDGKVEIVCDLPRKERKKNIASKGLGCCVFRSMEYAGRYQNEKELYDLPERMKEKGTPGGGTPGKLTQIMKEYAPAVKWGQDTTGDPAILEAILRSGRMAGVAYDGHDPHYGGSIAHMVDLVYFDRSTGWACISDNNYIEPDQFVWMSCDEFVKRWKAGGGGGWVTFLLKPPPPPVPHNDG